LQTSSLIRQAQVYFYLQRPRQRLQAYEQALQYSHNVSPLLQGRVYIGLTETYSHLGREQEALHFLSLAHQIFPAHCEADHGFAYTHFNRWSLTSFEGQMYLNLKQFRRAWELFERVDKIVPKTLVPNRVELVVRQAAASSGLDDIEQSCFYVEAALRASIEAGNELRRNEVSTIYEAMCDRWKHEPRINALIETFL
jgi:tetratricopeptide (TPR) repeat protein